MAYEVQFEKKAFKQLEKLTEETVEAILEAIEGLEIEPRPAGCKKLKGREAYRIRIGDYRVIYEIFDNKLLVLVVTIGHRKDVYE